MSEWKPTALEEQRLVKLDQLAELGVDAYPLRVQRTHEAAGAVQAFEQVENSDEPVEIEANTSAPVDAS